MSGRQRNQECADWTAERDARSAIAVGQAAYWSARRLLVGSASASDAQACEGQGVFQHLRSNRRLVPITRASTNAK